MENIKKIIDECKALVEQSEPFQKKVKAKHSRLKKRVIGHGGQPNSAPFSEKPSFERSKSAPPIGEIKVSDVMGFLSKKPEKQTEKYTDYNKVYNNIYVGAAPIKGGKLMLDAVKDPKFGKIFIMSKEVVDILQRNYDELPDKIDIGYAIQDTLNPTQEEKNKLKQVAVKARAYIKTHPNSGVLFTCSKGLNRSAAGACLTMISLGLTPDDAIDKVEAARGSQALTLQGKPQEHAGFVPIIKKQD